MSAFAFMAFAMAVVNAALSSANNVNDNNNNNNNNNNDNNNNLANINIANANNAGNNENMAMAGRRRRLQRLENNSSILSNLELSDEVRTRPELFATRVMVEGDNLVYSPLRIGYDDQEEEARETLSGLPISNSVVQLSSTISPLQRAKTALLKPTNTSMTSSSYLDRLLAGANSLLGRKRRKRSTACEEDHLDQLEGELAELAITFIGLSPTANPTANRNLRLSS